ncbi:MAG: sugar ABC transporter substrate-binding protein [Anaerolineae bacterium]|nr:sugar ABC transporter substrate-binding protein [Anaerolineae bacterium]
MSFKNLRAKMKTLGLLSIMAGLLIAILSGCAGAMSLPEPVPTAEPVTIRFAYDEDVVYPGYYENLAEAFHQRYPHVTIDLLPAGWQQDWDVVADPEFWIASMQRSKRIRSLDSFIAQDETFDRSDFYPAPLEFLTVEGELMAIPSGTDISVMYYNRDLFDQYGVPYPEIDWTWDDFLSRATALRDLGAGVYGYAPQEGYFDSLNFVYQHGGRIFDDLQNPTQSTFDDPLAIEALEWYADLLHKHNVAPTPSQVSDFGSGLTNPSIGFTLGKAGMYAGNLSDQGGVSFAQWKFRWGIAPLPREAQFVTGAWGWGYGISSDTPNPQAAWQWVVFLSEQMPSRLVPARRSLAESEAYKESVTDYAAIQATLEEAQLIPYMSLWTEPELNSALWPLENALRKIVRGDATPQEAMTAAQEQAEK